MKSIVSLALFAVLAVVFSPAAASVDPLDNPQYVAWYKCAVGSSVTYHQTMVATQAPMEITKTLKEKADDHVTVEDSTNVAGAADDSAKTESESIPAKLDKSPDQKGLPNETIQVGDKKIDCKVSQISTTANTGSPVTIRLWTSDEVPGGLVKMAASSDPQGKDVIATLVLKKFVKK